MLYRGQIPACQFRASEMERRTQVQVSKTPGAALSPPGAWQIRVMAAGSAALLYASEAI
jgi:hypothetical protein